MVSSNNKFTCMICYAGYENKVAECKFCYSNEIQIYKPVYHLRELDQMTDQEKQDELNNIIPGAFYEPQSIRRYS